MSQHHFFQRILFLPLITFTIVRCSTPHYLKGENAFQAQEFHDAYVAYHESTIKKEEPKIPLTTDVVQKRMEFARLKAVNEILTKGKRAFDEHNFELLMQMRERAQKNYADHPDIKAFLENIHEFHRDSLRRLKMCEDNPHAAGALKDLIKISWYQSKEDNFYSRYTYLVSSLHKDVLKTTRKLIESKDLDKARESINDALRILPADEDSLELAKEIDQRLIAKEYLKLAKRFQTQGKMSDALEQLERGQEIYKDKEVDAQIQQLKPMGIKELSEKALKICSKDASWNCRLMISKLEKTAGNLDAFPQLQAFIKPAEGAIASRLYDLAHKSLKKNDAPSALLYFKMARSLGEPTSPMLEKAIQEKLDQDMKYTVSVLRPKSDKNPQAKMAEEIISEKLQDKFLTLHNPETNIRLVYENFSAQPINGVIDGRFEQFGIKRAVKKENRSAEYVHHQERQPNPAYNQSRDRMVAAEGERKEFFTTVQLRQKSYDEALEYYNTTKKTFETDRESAEVERKECQAKEDERKAKERSKALESGLSDAIRKGDDGEVQALLAEWKEATPNKRKCEYKDKQEIADKSEKEMDQAKMKLAAAEKELKSVKQKFLEITNGAFDAEIKHKEISPTITVNVMKNHDYSVQVDDAKGDLRLTYQLVDKLTGQTFVSAEAAASFYHSDFTTEEVGIHPPEYDYQVLEAAHESTVPDDSEITTLMAQNAAEQLAPQIQYALRFHGRRFVEAANRAETEKDRARYAILAMSSEKHLLDQKNDVKKMKELLEQATGFNWDSEKLDFNRIPAGFNLSAATPGAGDLSANAAGQ